MSPTMNPATSPTAAGAEPIAAPTTLDALCRARAAALGDKLAMAFRGDAVSFSELAARAEAVAAALVQGGIAPGQRIATLDKNHGAHFELLFGAARAGTVLIPISYRLAAAEVEYILGQAEPELLFVGTDFVALVEGLRARLPRPPRIVYLDGDGPDGYAAWRAGSADSANSANSNDSSGSSGAPAPAPAARPDDVLLQMYTSGTTGHPKGVLLTHRSVIELLDRARLHLGTWQDGDVCLQPMPLFHIGGTAWGLISIYCGASMILMREADPAAILSLIESQRVTKMFAVPALILFLLQNARFAQTDLRSLRHIVYGASPISETLLAQALAHFPCEFGQVYGLTETGGTIAYLSSEDHRSGDPQRIRSCGRPMPGVDIRVVDASGTALPPGEIGEIVCRSGQVMRGYHNAPGPTAEVLRGEWLHTGDAGYFDAAGYLYIHDRVKDMIISGGENIYPAEVEGALLSHPAVADAAVIGIPDPSWGESVKAFVVLRPGAAATSTELTEHVRARIARFKVPRDIAFVSTLPRNAAGKLLKRELRQPYWQQGTRQVH